MLRNRNVILAATSLAGALGASSLRSTQTPDPWVYYGHFITDSGDSVVARYEIQPNETPWQIALAPFGRRPLPFENEAISPDTGRMEFRWPGRLHANCTLQRQGEDLWVGECRNPTTGSERGLAIGVTQSPDFGQHLSPSAVDVAILRQATGLLSSEAVWNRADDRICEDDAETGSWSLFCALYQASINEAGSYLHLRPAMEAVRRAVFESARDRIAGHALRDYNNDHRTSFAELHQLLERSVAVLERQIGRPPR